MIEITPILSFTRICLADAYQVYFSIICFVNFFVKNQLKKLTTRRLNKYLRLNNSILFNFHQVLPTIVKNIPSTFLGPVNGRNTQTLTEFLSPTLQNVFLWLVNKARLKFSNVVIQFSSLSSFLLSFLAHKKCFMDPVGPMDPVRAKLKNSSFLKLRHCTSGYMKNYLENQSSMLKW